MRLCLALIGLAILRSVSARDTLDDRAYDSIADIIANTKLTGEQARNVADALVLAAEKDPSFENALIFRTIAGSLVRRAGRSGASLLFDMSGEYSDSAWNAFRAMAPLYPKDGPLPSVRYSSVGAGTAKAWLRQFDTDYYLSDARVALEDRYDELRERGYTPGDALTRILDQEDPELDEGLQFFVDEMQALGRWALTGYGKEDAVRDTYAFLEGHYATLHPNARDIKGVAPTFVPSEVISVRIVAALRADNSHLMALVRTVLSRAMDAGAGPGVAPREELPFDLNGVWRGSGGTYTVYHRDGRITITRNFASGGRPGGEVMVEGTIPIKSWGTYGDGDGEGKYRFHGYRPEADSWVEARILVHVDNRGHPNDSIRVIWSAGDGGALSLKRD